VTYCVTVLSGYIWRLSGRYEYMHGYCFIVFFSGLSFPANVPPSCELICAKMRPVAFKILPGYTSVPSFAGGSDPSHSNLNPDFCAARPFVQAFPLFLFCEITTRDVDYLVDEEENRQNCPDRS